MSNREFQMTNSHWIIVVFLLIAAYASFLLVQPYINPIIMAFIIALLILPLHERIDAKMPKHPNLASLISCLILTFVIAIPLFTIIGAVINQGVGFTQNAYDWASTGGVQTLLQHDLVSKALDIVNNYLPFDNLDAQQIAQRVAKFVSSFGSQLVAISAKILGDVTGVLMSFFMMLFVLFFFLRDHDKIIEAFRHVLPFSRSQEDRLLNEIEAVSKSAVLGSFLTALAQGVAGGFALWIAGFPGFFWGSVMCAASFIPVVGTALVWVPIAIYLALVGDFMMAGFLTLWGIVVVGSIDNLLRPLLMQGSAGMNTLMIFFSLLGGLHLFGLAGLIYGPLIFAITLVLFKLYEEEFSNFLNQQDNS